MPPPSSRMSPWEAVRASLVDTASDFSSWMIGDDAGVIDERIVVCFPPLLDDNGGGRSREKGASSSSHYSGASTALSSQQHRRRRGSGPPRNLSCFGVDLAEADGRARVRSVDPRSPAAAAGLLPGDCLHHARVENLRGVNGQ